jgi:tetratricopeptide (TPR) repeat protein
LLAIADDQKDYADAQYYLGRISFNAKAYDDAEEFFEEAADTNDKIADYHYWYGSTLGQIATDANTLKQGMLAPKIKDEFEKTIALDSKNLDAHWGLVEFYTKAPGFMGGSWEKATQTAGGIMKINKLKDTARLESSMKDKKNSKKLRRNLFRPINQIHCMCISLRIFMSGKRSTTRHSRHSKRIIKKILLICQVPIRSEEFVQSLARNSTSVNRA